MAQRVEEIKRVRREITNNEDSTMANNDRNRNTMMNDDNREFEEEYYDVGSAAPDEAGLNTASGVLALVLLALAVYLIYMALR